MSMDKMAWEHWHHHTGSDMVYQAQNIMAAEQLESIVLLPDIHHEE